MDYQGGTLITQLWFCYSSSKLGHNRFPVIPGGVLVGVARSHINPHQDTQFIVKTKKAYN
jgi:hypothetical protein